MFKKFEKFESNKDWEHAIIEIENLLKNNPSNEECYIRIIYYLHNYLNEEYLEISNGKNNKFQKMLNKKHKEYELKLLKYFNEGRSKFNNNPNFLFFIGKILPIAEWYFGLNDDDKPKEERLFLKMQAKAVELEPNNKLFKLYYEFSKGNKSNVIKLQQEVLNDKQYMNFLENYGFPGMYILEGLGKLETFMYNREDLKNLL